MEIALSCHNDDVELFAAYALMRYRPLVIVCLRSFIEQEVWVPPGGGTWEERERETSEAMEVLGCDWMQFVIPDKDPDWGELSGNLELMASLEMPERVWAPLPEDGGHHQHNVVGETALRLFGPERVVYYATYTHARGRTQEGVRQTGDASEEQQKKNALSRYRTQISDPRTRMHFERRPLDEFYSAPTRSSHAAS